MKLLLGVPGAILAILVFASIQVLFARGHLLAGAHDLLAARARLTSSSVWRAPQERRALERQIQRAEQEFASARSDLSLWTPLLDHLDWLPAAGPQLAAASPVADTAYFASRAGSRLLSGLSASWPVLDHSATGSRFGTLPILAVALGSGASAFHQAWADTIRARAALRSVPARTGNAMLDSVRLQIRPELALIRAGAAWLSAAPDILGTHAPSRYLLVLQDPTELRATGGFIGAEALVTVRNGMLTSHFGGSDLGHEITSVPPPLPAAYYTPEAAWLFRDSNWSPDFPLAARLERWFYGEDTGRWVDGVISVDDTALPGILGAIGPVYLPAYARWVTAQNMQALARQYVAPGAAYHGPSSTGTVDTLRKQFFGWVLQALLPRLQGLSLERWVAIGTTLSADRTSRDIMLYDRRAAVESAISAAQADGRLRALTGDFLAVVDDNRSYNKINPYVRESIAYAATIRPDWSLDATLRIRYHVNPSPTSLEGFGPGFGTTGSKHDYLDFVRVYVPPGARLLSAAGIVRWAPAPAYGLTQLAGEVLVRSGDTDVVTLRYTVPAAALDDSGSRYVLTVRHQPGSTLSAIHVHIRAPGAAGLDRTLPVDRDAHLSLPLPLAASPDRSVRSTPHGPLDPYVPFTFFRDPRHPL